MVLALARVAFCSFGLDQSKRISILAPEDVIDKAFILAVGHTRHFVFAVFGFIEWPSSFFQEEIDEQVAGFGFVIVVIVGGGGVGALDFG